MMQFFESLTQKELSDFRTQLVAKYPLDDFSITLHEDIISLDGIRVLPEAQKQGVGKKVMQELLQFADQNNLYVALTPLKEAGTKHFKFLERWYRAMGFRPNKGRYKDFRTMRTMIRPPQTSL